MKIEIILAIKLNSILLYKMYFKKKWIIFLLILLCFGANSFAQKVYEFNSTCQQAYKEIGQLKIASGKVLIEKAKLQNANNLIPVFLESYIDVIEFFFISCLSFHLEFNFQNHGPKPLSANQFLNDLSLLHIHIIT